MNRHSRRHFIKTTSLASASICAAGTGSGTSAWADSGTHPGTVYRSTWDRMSNGYWTGPDTWANPWEDWRIDEGWLVCTKNGSGNRTVHCLTHQLNDTASEAEIAVTIAARQRETGEGATSVVEAATGTDLRVKGSAGFELGIRVHDPIDDYRSRLLFGAGLHVGLNANGELFIGRRDRKEFPELATAWGNGRPIRLTCKIHPEDARGTFRIDLSAAVAEGDAPAVLPSPYRISKSGIPAKDLVGNVALVNNLPRATARVPQDGLFAFSDWTIGGPKITADPARAFGPILWTLYTLSDRVLKLTAQMPPLGEDEDGEVRLQIDRGAGWETISTADIDPLARTATFRVADWDDSRETPYRACWTQTHRDGTSREHAYDGTIRKDPKEKAELVVAGYCCFTDFLFPNANIVEQTRRIDPDVMFFVGDQIYEGVGGFGILRDGDVKRMTVNYLRKLALLGWSFRDLTKDRPTVWMPDDHDVYQGNVWGAGGRKITLDEWYSPTEYRGFRCLGTKGGYVQPAEFIKAVERTQTAHLPDPYDPTPIEQGIGVYYTGMKYGGVSFAILEDRKFKSGPMVIPRHQSSRPDWLTDRAAALAADVPDAELLGERQLKFLRDWAADWHGVSMKMAVSQTIFCNAATHHGGPTEFLVADTDSNGWPQSGRNAALDVLRRGGVFMLGGDQHLPTLVQHGIERHHDAGVSFCVPAGAVGYQRWWRPEEIEAMPREGDRHGDRPNTGRYRDGFGNRIDVLAVANPPLKRSARNRIELGRQKSSGFGMVRVNKARGTFTAEAWPVDAPPTSLEGAEFQYPGWPATISVEECVGSGNPTLPTVELRNGTGTPLPVVRVLDSAGQTVSTVRMTGEKLAPRVFDRDGEYTVEVVVPEEGNRILKRFENVRAGQAGPLVVGPGR